MKMNLEATKLNVLQKIMEVDNSQLLSKIDRILDSEMVVGYTISGKPLTKESYNARLEIANTQINEGKFISQEELENKVKNW